MAEKINLGKIMVTLEGEFDSTRGYDKYCEVSSNGSSYVSKKPVPVGTPITDTTYWQKRASKGADGADGIDGTDGLDAYQPFKGWFNSASDLNTAFASPQVGDYAYVKGATASDPTTIYECTTAGTWALSQREFNPANNQSFASGEELNTTHIVDNLNSSSSTNVLSARMGDVLNKKIKDVEDGLGASFNTDTGTTTSINKIDAVFTDGYYMNLNGVTGAASTLQYSQHIPVEEGMAVCGLNSSGEIVTAIRFLTAFDGSGNAIQDKGFDGAGTYTPDYIVPSGVASVVITYNISLGCSKIQTSKTTTATTYSLKDKSVTESKLSDDLKSSIDEAKTATTSIVEKIQSRNLINKNDDSVVDGKYMSTTIANNTNMMLSAPIGVEIGKSYVFSGSSSVIRFVSFLANKTDTTALSYVENISANGTFTVPSGASYIRLSISKTVWSENIQLEEGSVPTSYQDYFEPYSQPKLRDGQVTREKLGNDVKLPLSKYSSALGSGTITGRASSLSNDSIVLSDFPKYVKKSHIVGVSADITSFNAIEVGLSSGDLRGSHIRITASTIYFQSGTQSGTDGTSVTHGLNITSFIKVSYVLTLGRLDYIVSTLGGYYKGHLESTNLYQECYGRPYIAADADTTLTNVVLQGMSQDLRLPVWVIGDSYTSIFNDIRWTSVMLNEFGYKNWMLQGLAGANSVTMYADLTLSLALGTPKYIVWLLGMNDGDSSSDTPNSSWLSTLNNLISVCQLYDITLILATIPMGDNVNNEAKNAWVRQSGYRYIDCAKAVHGETYIQGVDNWYEGYNADSVHPTALGAKALASQVLVDFPEIMQY